MKRWTRPYAVEEEFQVNENVAQACYLIACEVGSKGSNSVDWHWDGYETTGQYKVSHSPIGTKGTCGDEYANRVLADDTLGVAPKVQENNSADGGQGWIDGAIDYYKTPLQPGSIVYWHTTSKDGNRRWNHYGYVKLADANHPNHS